MWSELTPASAHVEPGGTIRYVATIRNTSPIVEQFHIEVLGEMGPWAQVRPTTMEQFPGEQGSVFIDVTAPRESGVGPGERTMLVRISARSDPGAALFEEASLGVGSYAELRLAVQPANASGRASTRQRVTIANLGNVEQVVQVTAQDADEGLSFSIKPATLRVSAGLSGTVRVRTTPLRSRRNLGARSHPFRVLATTADGVAEAVHASARFTAPRTRRMAVAVAALAVLAGVTLVLRANPAISAAGRLRAPGPNTVSGASPPSDRATGPTASTPTVSNPTASNPTATPTTVRSIGGVTAAVPNLPAQTVRPATGGPKRSGAALASLAGAAGSPQGGATAGAGATPGTGAPGGSGAPEGSGGTTTLPPALLTQADLFAMVDPGGQLVRGSTGTTVRHVASGRYQVTFADDVSHCAAVADLGYPGTTEQYQFPAAVTVAMGPDPATVTVDMVFPGNIPGPGEYPSDPVLADNSFALHVDCNEAAFAVVDADATTSAQSPGVSVTPTGPGAYIVDLGTDVSTCAPTATVDTAGGAPLALQAFLAYGSDPATIAVRIDNATTAATSAPFSIIVTCGGTPHAIYPASDGFYNRTTIADVTSCALTANWLSTTPGSAPSDQGYVSTWAFDGSTGVVQTKNGGYGVSAGNGVDLVATC